MSDDDLVLLVLVLLWRLVDSLIAGAMWVVLALAGITVAAAAIAWAGRALPTGRPPPSNPSPARDRPDLDRTSPP